MRTIGIFLAVAAVAAATGRAIPARADRPLPYTGVSTAGGEFYDPVKTPHPVYGQNYVYPNPGEFAYFAGKGMNIFRVQFLWETLQPTLNEPLDPQQVDLLKTSVDAATGRGLYVLLDPHDYARYRGIVIGSPDLPDSAFADFWSRLAEVFKNDRHIWFGLVNEPHDMPTEQWLGAANAAIAAIRATGAKNLITVPGNAWTGAMSWSQNWYGTPNATVMLGIKDPDHNYVIEVHQYLDSDNSGTHVDVVSPTIGSERLKDFTEWCRAHHLKAFLGEFAAGNTPMGHAAVSDMLDYMEQNRDVWTGFTWWAAGSLWGDYMYTLEPKDGQDRPQMAWLEPYLQGAH